MSALVTDTHAAIWHFTQSPLLSPVARLAFNQAAQQGALVYLPTICLVEIIYLIEKGRFTQQLWALLSQTLANPASGLVSADLNPAVAQAVRQIPRATVPEMPDRIIAATALALGLPLVTADTEIRNLTNITIIW